MPLALGRIGSSLAFDRIRKSLDTDVEILRASALVALGLLGDEAAGALIPSLLLQPLVENSIKYAIANAINGGSIAVSAAIIGQELELVVADDDGTQ